MLKKLFAGVFVALLITAIAATVFRIQIGQWLFSRAVEKNFDVDRIAELPDGLHAVLCGSGSPLADPARAGPCTAIIAGQRLYVVDTGGGSVRNFGPMGLPLARTEALFLTHFHSDHIDGLGEFLLQRWAVSGSTDSLTVYGPPGVSELTAGIERAYDFDKGYRIDHHGNDVMPASGFGATPVNVRVDTEKGAQTFFTEADLTVTAFIVNHAPVSPAIGYRFDYKGRSIVVSGDTTVDENLIRQAGGADVLIHEALNDEMVARMHAVATNAGQERLAKILADIPEYHTTPVQAADAAARAGVTTLVLTHIVPPLPSSYLNALYLKGTKNVFDGEIVVGTDGLLISLPAAETSVNFNKLLN